MTKALCLDKIQLNKTMIPYLRNQNQKSEGTKARLEDLQLLILKTHQEVQSLVTPKSSFGSLIQPSLDIIQEMMSEF
jgi:hypothetical protein